MSEGSVAILVQLHYKVIAHLFLNKVIRIADHWRSCCHIVTIRSDKMDTSGSKKLHCLSPGAKVIKKACVYLHLNTVAYERFKQLGILQCGIPFNMRHDYSEPASICKLNQLLNCMLRPLWRPRLREKRLPYARKPTIRLKRVLFIR